MTQLHLNTLRPLTVITGNSFSNKTQMLKEIAKKTKKYSKFINLNTEVTIEVNKEFEKWFKSIFYIDFIQNTKITYASKIISLGLNCKKDECLIIENPEINLHPRAIFKMAKFLAYLVSEKGIRVVLETYSEHIVNSICHSITTKELMSKDVVFFNKENKDSVTKILVDKYGKFLDEKGYKIKYPNGFFNANSAELWELI